MTVNNPRTRYTQKYAKIVRCLRKHQDKGDLKISSRVLEKELNMDPHELNGILRFTEGIKTQEGWIHIIGTPAIEKIYMGENIMEKKLKLLPAISTGGRKCI